MTSLLSINNYYYRRGGSEAIFFEHNSMFEALGWTVACFSMQHPRNLSSPWSSYFVDEIELSGDYSLLDKIVRLPKVVYSFEARRRLGQLIDRVRPDVAHAHNIYHHISPSILGLLHRRGVPTVLTLHDLKIACPAYSMLARDGVCERCRGGKLYNVVLNRCIGDSAAMSLVVMLEALLHRLIGSYRHCVNRFIVPSRFYLEKFCDWGMPRDLFRHVPNFVDSASYQPQYAPGRSFLYFGRVARQKGLATLIRAAARTGITLRIAGTGPEETEMRELADRLRGNTTLLGHLSGSALHEEIRRARAVILPSEWYENAPVSLLESYALGKPVIGARIGGIPELIREQQTGLCFESGDEASLVGAIEDIRSRPDAELVAMGRAGREWVERDFSPDQYRRRILAAYGELGVGSSAPDPLPLYGSS